MDNARTIYSFNLEAISFQELEEEEQIQKIYIGSSIIWTSTALVFYTTLLKLGEEIEYIWYKRLSLPALLYIFTRYGSLIYMSFLVLALPNSRPYFPGYCNATTYVANLFSALWYTGIQGLLVTRAYSLCRGRKIIRRTLTLLFLFNSISNIVLKYTLFSGCLNLNIPGVSPQSFYSFGQGIIIAATGFLVVFVSLHKVWGTWKLKREAGIQRGDDLVSILLKQEITGLFIAIFVSLMVILLYGHRITGLTADFILLVQNCLSGIFIADFSLELRRSNAATIEAGVISLPPISSARDALYHIHQSIILEMGGNENTSIGRNDVPEIDIPR